MKRPALVSQASLYRDRLGVHGQMKGGSLRLVSYRGSTSSANSRGRDVHGFQDEYVELVVDLLFLMKHARSRPEQVVHHSRAVSLPLALIDTTCGHSQLTDSAHESVGPHRQGRPAFSQRGEALSESLDLKSIGASRSGNLRAPYSAPVPSARTGRMRTARITCTHVHPATSVATLKTVRRTRSHHFRPDICEMFSSE